MKARLYYPVVFILFLFPGIPGLSAASIPTPKSYFGYTPGTYKLLFNGLLLPGLD